MLCNLFVVNSMFEVLSAHPSDYCFASKLRHETTLQSLMLMHSLFLVRLLRSRRAFSAVEKSAWCLRSSKEHWNDRAPILQSGLVYFHHTSPFAISSLSRLSVVCWHGVFDNCCGATWSRAVEKNDLAMRRRYLSTSVLEDWRLQQV